MQEQETSGIPRVERATAFLLGLAAIGIALVGFQANLWNGKTLESFSEANRLAIEAGRAANHATALLFHDFEIDALAKEKTVKAMEETDPSLRARLFHAVSYLYAGQMSAEAYGTLALPAANRVPDIQVQESIAESAILAAAGRRLDDAFASRMLARRDAGMSDATARFGEGRHAGSQGDRYALLEVIFAVSLFFGGISLVFGGSLWLATVAALAGYSYVVLLPWAWL
jgi:uncharacterized phage protein gp47/JayE